MQVSRQTAAKYNDRIVELGLLQEERLGYTNTELVRLFVNFGAQSMPNDGLPHVELVHVNKIPVS